MNIDNYIESGRDIYLEFAARVAEILNTAISNSEMSKGIQQVQHRAKDVESLSRKLKGRDIYHSENIAEEIKDLAGCRIIFYQNDDLNTFLQSPLISDNFSVDWDESKIHHPDFDTNSVNDLYMGHHFIISLDEQISTLPRYERFLGLRCEVQAQTLLNHAWSETIHDITYKKRTTDGFGVQAMSKIEDRLTGIMKDYLRPASYEFQKVKYDYIRLESGRELFEKDINKLILEVEDSNKLYELLEQYKDYVLPNYLDHEKHKDEIYGVIEGALVKAIEIGVTPIETPYGDFEGKDYNQILTEALSILCLIKYLDFDRTLNLLLSLCKTHVEPAQQEILCGTITNVTSYNEGVLNDYGYIVQRKILDKLEVKTDAELSQIQRFVFSTCDAIFSLTIEKTTRTHDQVTLSKANLPGSKSLSSLNESALRLSRRLTSDDDQVLCRAAYACMKKSCRTPITGEYDQDLLNIILSNTNSVISFYIEDIVREDYELLQATEESLLVYYQRALSIIGADPNSSDVKATANTTLELIAKFRKEINKIPKYAKYKVLVGFRSVFDKEWDEKKMGWKEKEEFIAKEIESYIEAINDETISEWIDLFSICAKADSSDLATFQNYSKFLIRFSEVKPDLAIHAFKDQSSNLESFLTSIIVGLTNINRDDLLDSITDNYIKNGERLWNCIRPFAIRKIPSRGLLHAATDKAVEIGECNALHQAIAASILFYKEDSGELDTVILPAIERLLSEKDSNWIHEVWYLEECTNFFSGLSREVTSLILDSLINLHDIDYHAEAVLFPIANTHLDLTLEFFGKRLQVESKKNTGERYDAIPYEFQKLHKCLEADPRQLVERALTWYQNHSDLFQYRGANLISNTFPDFNQDLETKLMELIQTKDQDTLTFVTSILRNYKGETFLHQVCREIVVVVEGEGPFVSEVRIILEESGVLRGEFGFVEHCKKKQEEIQHWLQDENEIVREFANNFIRGLERQRASEQRIAEENVELRKHIYG
jgi:ppGpp synthetase/RelA/SpoT-type nucleotidyltranferase